MNKKILQTGSILTFGVSLVLLLLLFIKLEQGQNMLKILTAFSAFLALLQLVLFFVIKTDLIEKKPEIPVKTTIETVEKLTREQELEKQKKSEQTELAVKEISERIIKNSDTAETGEKFSENLLKSLASEFSIVQGVVFLFNPESGKYRFSAGYALYSDEEIADFSVGEGISGQVAKNLEMLNIENIPENYITVLSGLGSSSPKHLLIFPMIDEFDAVGIVEISTFSPFPENIKEIYKRINEPLGKIAAELIYPNNEKEETF